ncbi:MAG TPA: alpha/beta hydrolase domain-containing protein [Vicinamibacterales bacterium]|nr:alpha/beta hydrolase domain-containing protein [Vicinamibacterales bacterium]
MRASRTGLVSALVACAFLLPGFVYAEVTKVTIASRAVVAGGQAFGSTGPYEKLTGTIDFSLDPTDRHNARIADLAHATRGSDGRVHFMADLYVLQPADVSKGNGTLLFEIANRGRKGMLGRFNRAGASQDPIAAADVGDGFLMKEGYTLVWVGWQFDVPAPFLRVEAPAANLSGRVRVSFIPDEQRTDITPADLPDYLPVNPNDPAATLTVRDRFWDRPITIARNTWQLAVANGKPRIVLENGFEPGRVYEVDYPATGAKVAGVGLAAIRDAASAFVHRTDLPVRGRSAYVFGISQSGRFLRQFLHDGFNVDERDRRVFDAVWPHIAGAGQGSFNERFAMPGYSSFPATRFPYTDREQPDARGRRDGILAAYRPEQLPKVIYTNTSVEYWGQGRAAALTHTSLDGKTDATVPDNVRMYLLSGTQHGEAAFPPSFGAGQAMGNPTPQANVMRALLRAMHQWASAGTRPPDSRHPRMRGDTLVPLTAVRFPNVPGVSDPRRIEGPGQVIDGHFFPMPFLVPQVDADGNELAGIRVAEVSVPLATTTGWNFRAERIGNPSTIYALSGSYVPFARTRAERDARHDPRPSIEERYRDRGEYLQRIRAAADALVKDRFILAQDVEDVIQRATRHWDHATGPAGSR